MVLIKATQRLPIIYFFIHALVELVCFALLNQKLGPGLSFIIAFVFDFFAFVPQAVFGELNNRYRKLDIGSLGAIFMLCSIFVLTHSSGFIYLLGIAILGIGNALIHEAGAIATVTVSHGKLFPSALFVSGGSFGLIIGQTMGRFGIHNYCLILPLIILEVLILLTNPAWLNVHRQTPSFHITREGKSEWLIILVAFIVTIVRSYIGYAIPISWNKTLWQSFCLFFIMGAGKAMGGYLSDRIGPQKTGVYSTILCIPFLLIGKNLMLLSIIGVFLFSMTMSICFGMLLSVIKDNPGLAFGVTTLGLFLGACPMLFWGALDYQTNCVLIIFFSLLSAFGLYKTLR